MEEKEKVRRIFQKERTATASPWGWNDLGMFERQNQGPYISSIKNEEEGITRYIEQLIHVGTALETGKELDFILNAVEAIR